MMRPDWLVGGGELGNLIRSKDWSQTSLGPIEDWPISLRTTVSLCLASNFPINIIWGPEHLQIYNDGYRTVCGTAHPRALGEPYTVTWASAWSAIGKPFERALAGETSFLENQRMFLERNGFLEETFFTFSLSPIRDENGSVVGLFHPVTETTTSSLSERRIRALRDTANHGKNAENLEAACRLASEALSKYPQELPFTQIYLLDEENTKATLVSSTGYTKNSNIFPPSILEKVTETNETILFEDVVGSFGIIPTDEYPEPARQAFAIPIKGYSGQEVIGIFVAGVSTRLALDSDYILFYELLATVVSTVINDARAVIVQTAARKKIEANEIQLNKAIINLKIEKGLRERFVEALSHDLRTPLTVAKMGAQMMARDTSNSSQVHKTAARIVSNMDRADRMIRDLLDANSIKAGEQVTLELQECNINEITQDAIEELSSIHGSRFVFNELEVIRGFWDMNSIRRIIENLCSNAIKYGSVGTPVTISLGKRHNFIQLTVHNLGTPISLKDQEYIFEPYQRTVSASAGIQQGWGIGLALVRGLAKAHGGDVTLYSSALEGTSFSVFIPRDSREQATDSIPSHNS